jgi:hypothetical protein
MTPSLLDQIKDNILEASYINEFQALADSRETTTPHAAVRHLAKLAKIARRRNPQFARELLRLEQAAGPAEATIKKPREHRRAQAKMYAAAAAAWIIKHRNNPAYMRGFLLPELPGCFDEVGMFFMRAKPAWSHRLAA